MRLYCSKNHENPTGMRFCQYCGEKLQGSANHNISTGNVLDDPTGFRYQIARELGRGGFGRTYLAQDSNRFNELCVLKEFAPQVNSPAALQKAEELFEREAGVLYKLQHPQIPRFRELFRVQQEGKGWLFLVQDYVDGQTYRSLLAARQLQGMAFTEAEVTQLLQGILPVLEYIHSLGVIHRDISPDNLMQRNGDGLPVLIDFGGVKQVAATVAYQFRQPGVTGLPTRLGKIGYAPDEQIQRGVVFANSDLYALAVTVLVLLTGKEPQHLINPQDLTWQWRQEVTISPGLGKILDKMLAHRAGDRYQSAQEVLQALTDVKEVGSQQPTLVSHQATLDPTTNTPTPAPQGSCLGLLGKTGLVLLVIASAGAMGWWGGNYWLQSQRDGGKSGSDSLPTAVSFPPIDQEPTPTVEFSGEEQRRKEKLRDRRRNLLIDYNFYAKLVDQVFWQQNSQLRRRNLSNQPEDEQLREQWDKTASDLLDKLENANLSDEERRRLGKYSEADRERWQNEANQKFVSSRSLFNLTDAAYLALFPEYSAKALKLSFDDFLENPLGQVWSAIAAERLKAIQSGKVLEEIKFDLGSITKRVEGQLQPGEGKVYIAQLSAEQLMQVQLLSVPNVQLSVYKPKGRTPILENSSEQNWSGKLPESGYYEFVITANTSEAIAYQFNLMVETPPAISTPEPSIPAPSEVPNKRRRRQSN
jgi:serine/threonine-protein kinase